MIRLLRNVLFLLPLFPPGLLSRQTPEKITTLMQTMRESRITTRALNKRHAVYLRCIRYDG